VVKQCPTCHLEEETLAHFLTCTETEIDWNAQILLLTPTANETTELDDIHNLLKWALKSHRSPTSTTMPPEHLLSRNTRDIIRRQQKIGWHQLWKGRWSQAWVRKYNEITNANGEKWATSHETEDNAPNQAPNPNQTELINLEQKIQAIYDQQPKLDNIDRKVLSQPIRTVLRMTPRLQKDWIKRTEGFVKIGIKRAKQRIKHNTHSIANFFQPRVTPTSAIDHHRTNDPDEAANFRPP
jgi:hypothetical protein